MSYPRQQARTRRFTLGVPRAFRSGRGPSGPVVLFLRSDDGSDPVTHLWRHEVVTGRTEKLVDARDLGDALTADLPPEERARRERAREMAGGITGFDVDDDLRLAAFAVGGQLWTVDVADGAVRHHPTSGAVFDPRPAPDASAVAFHAADGLHVLDLPDGPAAPGRSRVLVHEDGVAWGRAEFVAAEEMQRSRGFWWSPDGRHLAVARVDERGVPVWHLADPASPWDPPAPHRYPAAGSVNADVSLAVVDVASGGRTPVRWPDRDVAYLAAVSWGPGPLTVLVQTRDQRTATVLRVDPATGTTDVVRTWHDDAWVELVPGTPAWAGEHLLTVEDRHDRGTGGTRTLCLDGQPVTPPGLQVREVVGITDQVVAFLASGEDPTQVHGHRLVLDGEVPVWNTTDEPGVHREVAGRGPGAAWVRISHGLDRPRPSVTVVAPTSSAGGTAHRLDVVSDEPVVVPRPRLVRLGPRKLHGALFLPSDDDGDGPLPVLLDPYGGPHAQRVLQVHAAHSTSQWLADQGFAVLVVDGRGTPGRGPAWERAVAGDLATPVLEDQVHALEAAARLEPRLDLGRVGIRGWSFGGYLAALAVLRRPDVFRAAVAGAPVTDWSLYDTHYTERYLGEPATARGAYAASSLVDADGRLLGAAPWPDPPPSLLLVHGLADDNVVAAHTLRLSAALLADGRAHEVLPLSGVTHMTPQEQIAEQLLLTQVRFLHRSLAPR